MMLTSKPEGPTHV